MANNNPQFPLYIPSKSRAETALTPRYLDKMNVPYRLVVEEQQYDDYLKFFPAEKLLILDKRYQDEYDTCDDLGDTKSKGPGPARNFIWEHSISEGYDWHWVMDDNIEMFLRLHNNQRIPVADGMIFKAMEDFTLRYKNVGMSGPQYFMFAPSRSKLPPFTVGTRIYSCNFIRNDLPFRWRGRYNEDTDLSLVMLKNGWNTIQFNAFLQLKVRTQTLGGGNTEAFYAEEGTMPKSKMLVDMHPDVAKLTWKFKRWHHHVDYSRFKDMPLIKRDDYVAPEKNPYKLKLVERQSARPPRKQATVAVNKPATPKLPKSGKPEIVDGVYQEKLEQFGNLGKPKYPIYVPSKGRADTIQTTACLKGLDFFVVVEPQDADDYKLMFRPEQILVMPENDKGIAYVRNFCKDHAKENGHTYHWQIDDNIKSFALRQDDKNVKCNAGDALAIIEATVDEFDGIGAAGMKHQAFAFAERNDIGYNRQVYTCMLLSTEPPARFRDGLIEDADYNLQILFDGYSVLLFNRVVMNKTTSMVLKGGNTEISHANGGREKRAIATQAQWPDVFSLKESKDGPRLAPSRIWSTFQQRPTRKVDN